MRQTIVDVTAFTYVSGSAHYEIDLEAIGLEVDVSVQARSSENVIVELITYDGESFFVESGNVVVYRQRVFGVKTIRLTPMKKTAVIAYCANCRETGHSEKVDPVPLVVRPTERAFTISEMVRRELTRRMADIGLEDDDINDLLDGDLDWDDLDDDFPDYSPHSEIEDEASADEDERVEQEISDQDGASDNVDPPEPEPKSEASGGKADAGPS